MTAIAQNETKFENILIRDNISSIFIIETKMYKNKLLYINLLIWQKMIQMISSWNCEHYNSARKEVVKMAYRI